MSFLIKSVFKEDNPIGKKKNSEFLTFRPKSVFCFKAEFCIMKVLFEYRVNKHTHKYFFIAIFSNRELVNDIQKCELTRMREKKNK